jgi:hypothetical protein
MLASDSRFAIRNVAISLRQLLLQLCPGQPSLCQDQPAYGEWPEDTGTPSSRSPLRDRQLPDDLLATSLHLIQVQCHHQQPLRTEGCIVTRGIQLAHELSLASDSRLPLCDGTLGPRQLVEQL